MRVDAHNSSHHGDWKTKTHMHTYGKAKSGSKTLGKAPLKIRPKTRVVTPTCAHCLRRGCVHAILNASAVLVVHIYYKSINQERPTSHTRSEALSQQYTEKWTFISTALAIHKLSIDTRRQARSPRTKHNTQKSTLRTCHNKG